MLDQYSFRTNASRIAYWGYSGGATAAEFALEQASTYAPELRIDGVAIGGLTANNTRSATLLSGGEVAGLLVQGLIGITQQYEEQRTFLDSRLKNEGPHNATEFYSARNMSAQDSLDHFAFQNIFEYFKDGRDDLANPVMRRLFSREGIAGMHGTPAVPMFIYHAAHDQVCPINDVDELVNKYCASGATILYQRNSLGGHSDEGTKGRQRALDYLGDVLDGTNVTAMPTHGCKTVNVTVNYDGSVPFY